MKQYVRVIGLLLLFGMSSVMAQNKVVVVPLFGDEAKPSAYQQSSALNIASYDIITGVSNPFGAPIGPIVLFNKQHDETTLEAFLFSQVKTDSISNEVSSPFVQFTLLVNGEEPSYYNRAGLNNDRRNEEISLWSISEDLPIGNHEIQVYARTNSIALGVMLDPDGYGGRIIIKETH